MDVQIVLGPIRRQLPMASVRILAELISEMPYKMQKTRCRITLTKQKKDLGGSLWTLQRATGSRQAGEESIQSREFFFFGGVRAVNPVGLRLETFEQTVGESWGDPA